MIQDKAAQAVMVQVRSLAVATPADRQKAADLWDAIRAFRKQATVKKEAQCKPLKAAWDEAKKPWDAFIKECEGYEDRLAELMGAYDAEQDRRRKIEQAKIDAKVAKQNAKIVAKAEEKGIVPVLKEAVVVAPAAKSIDTQAGTKQTRQEKVVYSVEGTPQELGPLMQDFPELFVIRQALFQAKARTGQLDRYACVKKTIEYVYVQRQRGNNEVEWL